MAQGQVTVQNIANRAASTRPDQEIAVSRSIVVVALMYLVALSVAEGLVLFADPRLAVLAHIVLLTATVFQASFANSEAESRLYLATSCAPLVRILSLSMPLGEVDVLYWYVLTGIPIIASAVAGAHALHLTREDLGLTLHGPHVQVLIAVCGISLGLAEYLILHPEPLIDDLSLGSLVIPALILLIGTGVSEELLFRGVMLSATHAALGWFSVLYVSALFAVLHLGYESALDVAFVFGVGVLFSLVVRRTRSIVGVSFSHGITNIMLFLILPNILD